VTFFPLKRLSGMQAKLDSRGTWVGYAPQPGHRHRSRCAMLRTIPRIEDGGAVTFFPLKRLSGMQAKLDSRGTWVGYAPRPGHRHRSRCAMLRTIPRIEDGGAVTFFPLKRLSGMQHKSDSLVTQASVPRDARISARIWRASFQVSVDVEHGGPVTFFSLKRLSRYATPVGSARRMGQAPLGREAVQPSRVA